MASLAPGRYKRSEKFFHKSWVLCVCFTSPLDRPRFC